MRYHRAPRLALVWLMALMLAGPLALLAGTPVQAAPSRSATTAAPQAAESAPRKVFVGVYAMTVQGLDQQDNSYYVDFYLWLRWRPDGDIDPSATVEFMNNIERWGLTQTPVYEEPKELPSGELTQQFHVQGRYFAALNLSAYPLDRHELPISIEDTAADSSQQVYVFDENQSGLDPAVRLPGWNIDGTRMRIDTHRYGTSFGESADRAGSDFSRATFAIAIDRPVNFFVWKLMLPLSIVMLVAISVLMVHPTLAEIRVGAPATALLALVFLQQAYSGTLPENGNLVLLDKIYAVSYGLIVALIASTILTSYRTRTQEDVDHARLIRIDRWVASCLAGTFVLSTGVLIALG